MPLILPMPDVVAVLLASGQGGVQVKTGGLNLVSVENVAAIGGIILHLGD
jgi:hypothetical protein